MGNTQATLVAGLDVGGTKTLAAVVDRAGQIVAEVRHPTTGGDTLVPFLKSVLDEVAGQAGVPVADLAAVGVGVPGVVNPVAGTVKHAVNLGVGGRPVDVAGPLGSMVDGPVSVANDVNQAAMGAVELLGLDGDVAYLSVGTGVALGLVLSGRLHHGATGIAGEIGHLPIDPYGPLCTCGQRGCLEAIASGAAIARRWPGSDGAADGHGDSSGDGRGDRDGGGPATTLFEAAAEGNSRAMAVRDDVCTHLAGAVALVVQTVDPDTVVIGGGVAEAGEQLLEAVRDALQRRTAGSPLLTSFDLPARVAVLPPGLPVGAIGAARSAQDLVRAAS